jgi:tRNA (guanine-N7-)-methyltransferase
VSRRLKTDIPGTDYRVAADRFAARNWKREFSKDMKAALPLIVELGFGRGEFLMHLARESPERAHIGVEVSRKRVLKMARRVARADLKNIRLVHTNAAHFAAEGLAPASVERVWINFSDPWPKKRHHPRRLVQAGLVERLSECLIIGGELEVATDDVPYAQHIDSVLGGAPQLTNAFAPDPWRREVLGRFPTAYELEWRAEGRPLHFWRYRRR